MRLPAALVLAALGFGLVACGEKPQEAGKRKSDQAPYALASGPLAASEWKEGDAVNWERQLASRTARGQNEYGRIRQP